MNHPPRNKNCRNISRHLTPADATLILRCSSPLQTCNSSLASAIVMTFGSFQMNDFQWTDIEYKCANTPLS